MIWGVLQFPGSCDERDALHACTLASGEARLIWHEERDLGGVDGVVVPGGFSYGDYLRAGAIARFRRRWKRSPSSPPRAARCSASATASRSSARPASCPAPCCATRTSASSAARSTCWRPIGRAVDRERSARRAAVSIPAKHGEGSYYAPEETLDGLEAGGRVAFRYAPGHNPNGSARDIAGVRNEAGNVLGLMPHPEHAVDPLTGSTDGLRVFEDLAGFAQ